MIRILEGILDDPDVMMGSNHSAKDLIGDESFHVPLTSDENFQYMLVVSFSLRDTNSYRFLNPDEPENENNIFPFGAFCQQLNELLDYNMFISKYQMSRIIVDDSTKDLDLNNPNRKGYEIVIEDPLDKPDYQFNIITEGRAAGVDKFLGIRPIVNIYIPFIPPRQIPFMQMSNSIYQLCTQMNRELGEFWPDLNDSFTLLFKTIHPTEWWDRPYTFSKLSTEHAMLADQYKKIYKRIYGEENTTGQYHNIIRYKILRNTDLWHYAEHAADVCNSAGDVKMTVTNIYQPNFDTNRYSTIDKYYLEKATKRTIPRIVGFQVDAANNKEVDIDTLENILINDFILKLPTDYCNSCLLTICVKCNVKLTNDVHTSIQECDKLKKIIHDRQDGYGKLYDYVNAKEQKWVFNPCTKDQIKVENTDCHNGTNGKRDSKIWRIVDLEGINIPTIRVFFCDKNGRVNKAPISEITWFGEEYRAVMHTINELMESQLIWDSDYKFQYGGTRFGLW